MLADAARFARHRVGDRWFVDEMYVKVAGGWVYLYRAVDQFGQVIDVYASHRRDSEAARRFFQRAGTTAGVAPVEVITDRAPTYPRPRSGGARGLAPGRAVREQPGRGRPRAAETAPTPDAGIKTMTGCGYLPRATLSCRTYAAGLPDRRRPARHAAIGRRVSPTGHGDLSATPDETPAPHAPRSTNATEPLKLFQMACADMIILNKVDLVNRQQIADIRSWLDSRFHGYQLIEASHCRLPLEILLAAGCLGPAPPRPDGTDVRRGTHADGHDDAGIFATWSYETDQPLSLEALRVVASHLAPAIYRVKGVVCARSARTANRAPRRRPASGHLDRRLLGKTNPAHPIVAIGAAHAINGETLQAAVRRYPLHLDLT